VASASLSFTNSLAFSETVSTASVAIVLVSVAISSTFSVAIAVFSFTDSTAFSLCSVTVSLA
jgi:hypothetical protein